MARVRKGLSRLRNGGERTSLAGESTPQPISGPNAPASEKPLRRRDTQPVRKAAPRVSKKKAKKRNSSAPSLHHMVTRSQAAVFPLMSLPPELRASIHAFSGLHEEPLSLANIKLAPELSLSRQLRSESLPVFFATNIFTTTIKSNWCVYAKHFHGPEHIRYKKTGYADFSPLLPGSKLAIHGLSRLPEQVVRFQKLRFRIDCCCCADPKEIGSLDLFIEDHKVVADWDTKAKDNGTTAANMMIILIEVLDLVEQIRSRPVFNGFTVEDVKAVASCFRYKEYESPYR